MGRFYRMIWWIRYSWARLIGLFRNKATNKVVLGSLCAITADSRIEGSLVDTTNPLIGQPFGIWAEFEVPTDGQKEQMWPAAFIKSWIQETKRSMKETMGTPRLKLKVMAAAPCRVTVVVDRYDNATDPVGTRVGSVCSELDTVGYHELVVFLEKQKSNKS
jgi:hypothetical protein